MMSLAGRMRVLMAGAGLLLGAGPAFSLDGADLVAKLNAAMGMSGTPLVVQTIDVRGSTVILRGTTYKPVETEPAIEIGDITLEGVEEDNGGYLIESIAFPDVTATEDKTTVSISDLTMSGITVPATATGDSLDSIFLYEEASTGPMVVTEDGKTVFSFASSHTATDIAEDRSAIGFALEVDGIKADLASVDDTESREALQSLELTTIEGTMSMSGSWQAEDGVVDLEEFVFDFANVGKLSMAMSFSGYTMVFVRAAQDASTAMQANASKESQDAASLAMLGLMQRLTFNSAEISFQDAGITARALDHAGKEQGVSGQDMAQMLKAMTPMVLAQYNVPKLQNMVSEAVNIYLDNPGNLTISAKPANPVPFPMIMGAAMGAPNTLPDVLGVTVEANKRQ